MRLLHVQTVLDREEGIQGAGPQAKIFKEHHDGSAEYVIVSHRWEDEVNYKEMAAFMGMDDRCRSNVRRRTGYKKIIKSCKQAKLDNYQWIWIDTCCIDKRSSSELQEAINSMYRWYEKSQKCYAYLDDVEDSSFPSRQDFSKFHKANGWPKWFSRGWTLQELIAPKQVEFFNKDWVTVGRKEELEEALERITRIPIDVLRDGRKRMYFCVAQIISWAADRETTRPEDRAYSLLGLFDVDMQMTYGEGKKVFQKLQLAIIAKYSDYSIFAWNPKGQFCEFGSVLASDPSYFRDCHDVEKVELVELINKLGISWSQSSSKLGSRDRTLPLELSLVTNVGIQIRLPVITHPDCESVFRGILACRDYFGNPITIDFKTLGPSSYRIPAAGCLRDSRPKLKILHLACAAPYSDEEQHYFKLDDRHATYCGFTRRGTFPRELTGDTVAFSSVTNDPVIIVYGNDDNKSRFAIALTYYLGYASVHVASDQCSVHQEVSWGAFAKKVYDLLWVAPVESRVDSGVKCAHLPRSIRDARVVWKTRNIQTDVMVDVEQCPGCCIGPHKCAITSPQNDEDGLDMPGFMKTIRNVHGLKLSGENVWLCECSGQRITATYLRICMHLTSTPRIQLIVQ
ncbi:heterokaryon incompatibility protein-domain-containing protein [Pisolithus sp. B1]|nr:heterokaryon incompatibility protein-domain-containing protein [Pisolithus sp. B1]